MYDPANEALQLCRGFLSETLRQETLNYQDLRDNLWRIFGVKQLLQSFVGQDHPIIDHLEAAQTELMAISESGHRASVQAALDTLPADLQTESSVTSSSRMPPIPNTNPVQRFLAWLYIGGRDHA